MRKIKTYNKISELGLKHFSGSDYEITDDGNDIDGIILRSFKMSEEHLTDGLLGIARAGAGVNNIPIDLCSERGIVVFNTPGANANAVKELVIAGLLLSGRKIIDGVNWVNTIADSETMGADVEKGKSRFGGPEISGKTIGVIGLGAIGYMVANACLSLGMDVIGYDPFISIDAAWSLSSSVKKAASLESLISSSDYITLHLPLNSDTKGMFDSNMFGKMKKGARLLNFARAELVNFSDLNKALSDGILSAYVTDFPTKEVVNMPNVIPIPHLGASTPESEDNCAKMAAIQLKDYLETGSIKNSVNFPPIVIPKSENKKLLVLHRNTDGVLEKIKESSVEYGLNANSLASNSRGQYGCAVIDVEKSEDVDRAVKEISQFENILKVRII